MAVDAKAVEAKINAGQDLTKEENDFIFGDEAPPEGFTPPSTPNEGEEGAEGKEGSEGEEGSEGAAATDEATQAAAAELKTRATAAGLAETATKEEVEAKEAEIATEEANNPFLKLERELAKPDGQADLTGFNEREKAYFHQMKRDRARTKQAEQDRDIARRDAAKAKKDLEEKGGAAAAAKPAGQSALEKLKAKQPDDILTVAEVLELVTEISSRPTARVAVVDDGPDPLLARALQSYFEEAQAAHPDDFEAVMELSDEIVMTNPKYSQQVAEALKRGDNPAEETYKLIKGDPAFAQLFPVAQTRVKARAKPAAKAVEKNQATTDTAAAEAAEKKRLAALKAQKDLELNGKKAKTTAHAQVDNDKPLGEYTFEDLNNMSDKEFRQVPKKIRDKYMEMLG